MNKKFIILLFISTFFLTSLVRADGPATQYVITMTKVELCETGSSLVVTNCVNPVQISETGSTAVVDIAGLGASGAASFGNMSKAKVGSTYTHIRTTLSRLVTVTGQDNNITGGDGTCVTVNGNNGAAGLYALGATTGTPASVTLVMPDTTTYNVLGGMGATLDNTVAGSTASTITQVAGTIAAADTHFASISALGKSVTIKAGQIPTIKAAFGTANAVRANGIGEGEGRKTCASSTKTLSIAPPDVSITIE